MTTVPAAGPSRCLVVGVTGNSGCGQSSFASMLGDLGAAGVHSLDTVGHRLLSKHWVREELAAGLKDDRLLGAGAAELRGRLSDMAFADERALSLIDEVMHPRMYRWCSLSCACWRGAGDGVHVLEGALLFELGIAPGLLDCVVAIRCDLTTASRRLYIRDSVETSVTRARWAAQWPIERKAAMADMVIDNSSSLEDLADSARTIWNRLGDASRAQMERIATDGSQNEETAL